MAIGYPSTGSFIATAWIFFAEHTRSGRRVRDKCVSTYTPRVWLRRREGKVRNPPRGGGLKRSRGGEGAGRVMSGEMHVNAIIIMIVGLQTSSAAKLIRDRECRD